MSHTIENQLIKCFDTSDICYYFATNFQSKQKGIWTKNYGMSGWWI